VKSERKLSATNVDSVRLALQVRGIAEHKSVWRRLKGGRTNEVWTIDNPSNVLICKVFRNTVKNPLYPNLPDAEYETLQALVAKDIAPEPVALLKTTSGDVLVYRQVAGPAWSTDTAPVARLLARVHHQRLNINLRVLPSGSDALDAQTDEILALCRTAPHALRRVAQHTKVAAVQTGSLIHTDVVTSNIIDGARGLRLIDWQCPAFGDPCEDIASFLSPAMQYLYAGAPLCDLEKRAFLAAYPDRNVIHRYHRLAAQFHRRIASYCQWKVEQGDLDYAHAQNLEISALQNARENNDEAGENDANRHIAERVGA